ncbi:DUF4178 domain-containing protein [Mycobacterium sp. PS03-16]|uniref:DUF4178 domain-containing protein n=1 Tax=Mycobacterium sp. PS03-16 TaxID=2559611 RepID=UPI001ADDBA04|nr:DUF4178 domain-containing protein [Mycobacterium sp. PS03-16]
MGTLLIVLAILLLAGAVIALVLAIRKQNKPKTPAARTDPLQFSTPQEFGPRQLGPGAIVSHGGIDFIVRGSVTLRQGPFVWWEHLLEGGPEPLWFSVEEDEGRLELALWTRRSDLALQPGGPLAADGIAFSEVERGRASYTTEGTTGLPAGGDMEFVDYADASGDTMLGFERWAPSMPWEISIGRTVLPGELTVYPAPPAGS